MALVYHVYSERNRFFETLLWGSNGLFDKELRAELGEVQELKCSGMAKITK